MSLGCWTGTTSSSPRRACEHLLKQDLGSDTEKKVNAFRQRYGDRLSASSN